MHVNTSTICQQNTKSYFSLFNIPFYSAFGIIWNTYMSCLFLHRNYSNVKERQTQIWIKQTNLKKKKTFSIEIFLLGDCWVNRKKSFFYNLSPNILTPFMKLFYYLQNSRCVSHHLYLSFGHYPNEGKSKFLLDVYSYVYNREI